MKKYIFISHKFLFLQNFRSHRGGLWYFRENKLFVFIQMIGVEWLQPWNDFENRGYLVEVKIKFIKIKLIEPILNVQHYEEISNDIPYPAYRRKFQLGKKGRIQIHAILTKMCLNLTLKMSNAASAEEPSEQTSDYSASKLLTTQK